MTIRFDNIKKYREALGWSQRRLEREAKLCRGMVSPIERRDKNDCHFSSIYKIAVALEVPVDNIVNEYIPIGDNGDDNIKDKILKKVNALSLNDKVKLLKYLEKK